MYYVASNGMRFFEREGKQVFDNITVYDSGEGIIDILDGYFVRFDSRGNYVEFNEIPF